MRNKTNKKQDETGQKSRRAYMTKQVAFQEDEKKIYRNRKTNKYLLYFYFNKK